MRQSPHVLLATLAGQPQIVTFTLDLLLARQYPITEVILVHFKADQRIQQSLDRLYEEFSGEYYHHGQRPIRLRNFVLRDKDDQMLVDAFHEEGTVRGTINTLYQIIGELKNRKCVVHLSITGGPRMMGMLALTVGSFSLDSNDYIWHIYTPKEVQEQAKTGLKMHVTPDDGIRLIEAPFQREGNYVYRSTLTFEEDVEAKRERDRAIDNNRCQQVIRRASPAQRRVLAALSRGWHPLLVAKRLFLSPATVHTHKTHLLSYCAEAWHITEQNQRSSLSYHFIQSKFADHPDLEHELDDLPPYNDDEDEIH